MTRFMIETGFVGKEWKANLNRVYFLEVVRAIEGVEKAEWLGEGIRGCLSLNMNVDNIAIRSLCRMTQSSLTAGQTEIPRPDMIEAIGNTLNQSLGTPKYNKSAGKTLKNYLLE